MKGLLVFVADAPSVNGLALFVVVVLPKSGFAVLLQQNVLAYAPRPARVSFLLCAAEHGG